MLFLFCFFKDEKELLSGFPPISQNKLQEEGVQGAVNINVVTFELHGDLVNQTFLQYNENLINKQDPQSQTESDETPEAKYLNEKDSEDAETNKTSAIPNFIT